MICNPLPDADVQRNRRDGTHKRDRMENNNSNNKQLGILERLALIAVPVLFTVLIVADAAHVI